MIPYFHLEAIPLGPVTIQVWGLFVAAGMAVAVGVASKSVRSAGLDRARFLDLATWVIVGAFIGGRLVYAYAYDPATFLTDPLRLLRVWEGGMSSVGGFIGAGIAALIYTRSARLPFLPYAEAAAFALPLGEGIGRIGCFLIHDHPGTLSHSLLAVRFPDGARLDHGLLLSLFGFAVFALFLYLRPAAKKHGVPFYLPLYMILYGSFRFSLDFLRAWDLPGADARYFWLTPAQYVSIGLFIIGLALAVAVRRQNRVAAPAEPPSI